ncbi:MAG: hypothetical protein U1E60_32190 [Reyranellaceae bacterium]
MNYSPVLPLTASRIIFSIQLLSDRLSDRAAASAFAFISGVSRMAIRSVFIAPSVFDFVRHFVVDMRCPPLIMSNCVEQDTTPVQPMAPKGRTSNMEKI